MSADDNLAEMLAFDPLAVAERVMGTSSKEDDSVAFFGLALSGMNSDRKEAALRARDDTLFVDDVDRYLRIVGEEGFEPLLADPFTGRYGPETFHVLWHPDGMLLKFDTFQTARVNSATVHYNVRPKNVDDVHWNLLSSSFPIDYRHDVPGSGLTRAGYHDAREALRFNLCRLREHWTLLNPWVEAPWGATRLLSYADRGGSEGECEATSAERLSRLPEAVRVAMGVTS